MKKHFFTLALVAVLASIVLPSCLVVRHDRDDYYRYHHHHRYYNSYYSRY